MFRAIVLIYLVLSIPSLALAELPDTITLKVHGVSVTMSNFTFSTAKDFEFDPASKEYKPKNPAPLNSDLLYPPRTSVLLEFDYVTDWKPSENQESVASLGVGIDGLGMQRLGYAGAKLKPDSGHSSVRLIFDGPNYGPFEKLEGDIPFKLVLAGTLKDNRFERKMADDEFKLKIKIDGSVELALSQLDAIKLMFRRLNDAEKRITELEKKVFPK